MRTYWMITMIIALLLFPFQGGAEGAPDWSCNAHDYQYDMSVYLTVRQNGNSVNDNKVVAVFCRDTCRGVAELQTVEGTSFYYVRVRSNVASGDTITFQVYDTEKEKTTILSEKLIFESLKQIGYPSQPWVATLPTVVTTDDLDQITETTEEIQLSGELTQKVVDDLKDKIQSETGGNDKLSSVDLSDVTINEKMTSLDGLFSGCGFLTSVTLPNLSSLKKGQNPFAGANPNCVVIASPATIVDAEMKQNVNIVQNGVAEQLNLQAGYPFSSPFSFKARNAVYRRTFTPDTKALIANALDDWEAICLPFTVTEFKAGEQTITPTTDQKDADFYLSSLTSKGFELVDQLQANTPYLIRMTDPAGTSIKGVIDFKAENVTIPASGQEYVSEGTSYNLVGTTKVVSSSDVVYKLNAQGNSFVRGGGDIDAFEAYVRPKSSTLETSVPVVLYMPVKSFTVNPATLSIKEGESKELSATISPDDATNKHVVWSVADNTVATVSASGKVTGIKAGTTSIIARINEENLSASCSVTVTKSSDPTDPTDPEPPATVKVTGVILTPTTHTFAIGETVTLTAVVQPANAQNKNVSWKSSDISVATVDATGAVTARKLGNAVVTVATEDGNFKANCQLTVNQSTGIEDMETFQIQVAPTIASDYITVSGLKRTGKIRFISFAGYIVKEVEATSSSVSVSVQELSAGFYLVTVSQGEEQYTYKLYKK